MIGKMDVIKKGSTRVERGKKGRGKREVEVNIVGTVVTLLTRFFLFVFLFVCFFVFSGKGLGARRRREREQG